MESRYGYLALIILYRGSGNFVLQLLMDEIPHADLDWVSFHLLKNEEWLLLPPVGP